MWRGIASVSVGIGFGIERIVHDDSHLLTHARRNILEKLSRFPALACVSNEEYKQGVS